MTPPPLPLLSHAVIFIVLVTELPKLLLGYLPDLSCHCKAGCDITSWHQHAAWHTTLTPPYPIPPVLRPSLARVMFPPHGIITRPLIGRKMSPGHSQ